MNRDWVLWNLREAKEELDRTIAALEGDAECDVAELSVALAHLYHHLNTAWNGRDAMPERVESISQEDFDSWRQRPEDLPL